MRVLGGRCGALLACLALVLPVSSEANWLQPPRKFRVSPDCHQPMEAAVDLVSSVMVGRVNIRPAVQFVLAYRTDARTWVTLSINEGIRIPTPPTRSPSTAEVRN
ncbi:hypothetical protein H920_14460 [Fukomys damarensis]|uniref:Uncharacterized protein n=1 Tax=Fukomys damarensis TaxID=885580 RepID=A0A091D111_FUKDA|nr:hypothetical protein H920_14460 [Fukomys damarensis]